MSVASPSLPISASARGDQRTSSTKRRLGSHSRRLVVIGGAVTLLLILIAIFGGLIAPYDPLAVDLPARLRSPLAAGPSGFPYVLGTDQLGRDILSRMLHAAGVTVSISLVAVLFSAALGVTLGILSGYFGGWLDMLLMRIADIQLAFPTILLALTIVAALGSSIPILIFVFVFSGWVRYVRIVRAQVLVLKQMQFAEAARSIGASHLHILRSHMAPNLMTEIVILMNLEVGRIILLESALSYLGLGVQPPLPTWGNMLSEGRLYLQTSWWVVTFPGLVIMLTVLGVNMFAEGLHGLFDPRRR